MSQVDHAVVEISHKPWYCGFKLQLLLQRGLPGVDPHESGFDRKERFLVGEKELDNDDGEL
ncbi:MAG: hypothetical protein ACYDHG_02565 [Desulfomonilaceae bacterium]